MERYHLEDEIKTGKRTKLNKELYSKVYSSNNDFHTEIVSIENQNVVDIMKVKELISSRENIKKENYITEITDSINTDIKTETLKTKDIKKYDINTAIELAKKKKNNDDEKSKYRKLSDTIFLKLDEIKKEQDRQKELSFEKFSEQEIIEDDLNEQELLKEKINYTNTIVDQKLDSENEKLTNLINKISQKNEEKLTETAKISLDLLENLKPSENSVVLSGINSGSKSMLDTTKKIEKQKEMPYEETLEKTLYKPDINLGKEKSKSFEFDVDKTFYTKSMNFNKKDFVISKPSKGINKFLNFLLFIIILIILALLVYVLLKFL